MSAQELLNELLKCLPFRAYGRGAVLTLLREMGFQVKNKTPLEVIDVYRDDNSGELVCKLSPDGKGEFTAALTNLKLDITHPLYRKVKTIRSKCPKPWANSMWKIPAKPASMRKTVAVSALGVCIRINDWVGLNRPLFFKEGLG